MCDSPRLSAALDALRAALFDLGLEAPEAPADHDCAQGLELLTEQVRAAATARRAQPRDGGITLDVMKRAAEVLARHDAWGNYHVVASARRIIAQMVDAGAIPNVHSWCASAVDALRAAGVQATAREALGTRGVRTSSGAVVTAYASGKVTAGGPQAARDHALRVLADAALLVGYQRGATGHMRIPEPVAP